MPNKFTTRLSDERLLSFVCFIIFLELSAIIPTSAFLPFSPSHLQRTQHVPPSLQLSKQAGSFFNPVPNEDESENSNPGEGSDETTNVAMESELQEILKERRKSIASEPSTINGIPSQQALGFGKKAQQQQPKVKLDEATQKPYIGIGSSLNDVTKPEYDDQGYTLYADEKTGERSRVFEALVDYPCLFTLKIVGANEGGFVPDMISIVASTCDSPVDTIDHSVKHNGKWTSVTVKAPVKSAEMLYQLYENVDHDPRVKFKF